MNQLTDINNFKFEELTKEKFNSIVKMYNAMQHSLACMAIRSYYNTGISTYHVELSEIYNATAIFELVYENNETNLFINIVDNDKKNKMH